MKTSLRLTTAAFVLAAFNLTAQTAAELGIQTYAGLTESAPFLIALTVSPPSSSK